MKRASLILAAAIVVIANVFALVHAERNRSDPAESDITLTERELGLSYNPNDEDSGVSLNLRWTDPGVPTYARQRTEVWLDQRALRELGFDTSVVASDQRANEFYQRQRPRRAFVALEYDGPAWRDVLARDDRELSGLPKSTQSEAVRQYSSRLVGVDADPDAARLRARHPDRSSVIIIPAVVRIAIVPPFPNQKGSSLLSGSVQEVPFEIHVPRPFSVAFQRLQDRNRAKYRVHIRYGASLEPWIVGVE